VGVGANGNSAIHAKANKLLNQGTNVISAVAQNAGGTADFFLQLEAEKTMKAHHRHG